MNYCQWSEHQYYKLLSAIIFCHHILVAVVGLHIFVLLNLLRLTVLHSFCKENSHSSAKHWTFLTASNKDTDPLAVRLLGKSVCTASIITSSRMGKKKQKYLNFQNLHWTKMLPDELNVKDTGFFSLGNRSQSTKHQAVTRETIVQIQMGF